jgi:pimeloyl-ACP methyl ester carboxylesterase
MGPRTGRITAILLAALLVGWRGRLPGQDGPSAIETAAAHRGAKVRNLFGRARPAAGLADLRFQSTGLSMTRPYAPGRIPVVFIHGLCGSPRQWSAMIRALEADPGLGGHYQFWTFGYSTGAPIPYSAHLLRRALREARWRLDPDGRDAALDRMVLVGHSMGGLMAKMTVQDSGTRLWDLYAARPPDALAGPPEARELFRQALIFTPLPEVRRVVFIATPHRGARLKAGVEPLQRLGAALIRPSDAFRSAHAALLECNGRDSFAPICRSGPPAGVGQLAWDHPMLVELGRLEFAAGVQLYSIIADRRKPPRPGGGDGVVSYDSAHLPGPVPETLVAAGHLCLDAPCVIEAIARILAEGRDG